MLSAVKTKLSNYLTPYLERNRSEANCAGELSSSSTVDLTARRKRPLNEFDKNTDSTPGKKKKENRFGFRTPLKLFDGFKWSSIFDNTSKENIVNMTQAESVVKNTTFAIPESSDDIEITSSRKILTASRKQRVPLSQISNTTILDLTQDDEDDDDLQITDITIDLTKPLKDVSSEKTVETIDLTKSRLFGSITSSSSTIGELNRKKSSTLLHETVRLDEKTRYKTLLAHYTNVYLPEYSESISPTKSGEKSSEEDEDAVVTLSSTSWFSKEYDAKPVFVDLTDDTTIASPRLSLVSPCLASPRRKFFHELLNESRSCSSLLQSNATLPSTTPPSVLFPRDSTLFPSPILSSTTTKPKADINALLDTDWIKKWRDTIDPLTLERERRIVEEEKRKEAIKRKQKEEHEALQKKIQESAKSEFVELTNEMKAEIKSLLGPGNSRDVLVEGFNAEITRADIATLRNSTWLNDEVVNFYFNLLKERSEKDSNLPKVHIFNTFFYPKIMKVGHSGVKRWTRKIDIFSYDLILIPIHLGMHWCLAVIDFKNKEIVYYDSLRGNNPQCIMGLKKYLDDESKDKKKCAFNFDDWKEIMPKSIPEQMNGCDCGVFACKYAEYRSRDAKFTFTQENMPYFRQRMVYEICTKKLL